MTGWHHQLKGHEWANSGRQWRTGKPGVPQSMGSQRVRHDWVTEQQQILCRAGVNQENNQVIPSSQGDMIVEDREAWCAAGHGVVKYWTQLSDWTTRRTDMEKDLEFSLSDQLYDPGQSLHPSCLSSLVSSVTKLAQLVTWSMASHLENHKTTWIWNWLTQGI